MHRQTVDDYIIHSICTFPTLYASSTFTVSSMKVMDQLLNVIGNGIRNNDELKQHLSFLAIYTREEADLWIRNKVFYGYQEVEHFEGVSFGKGDSVQIREDQLDSHPEIIHTMLSHKYPFLPYPNFQKKYSTVWTCPAYLKLGTDWQQMAICFYQYCRRWLKKHESKYSYAFPLPTQAESDMFLDSMRQRTVGKPWEQVCVDYGVSDAADLHDLCIKRWAKEKARIFAFIEETVKLLQESIPPLNRRTGS